MIMGFAAKVVPTLNGSDPRQLTKLWGPFILVNIGCFLRVSTQTLTDWYHGAFAFVGVSGMLEVTGLAWWGLGLIGIIWRGWRDTEVQSESNHQPPPPQIERQHYVGEVLEWYPQTEAVFMSMGFTPLKNPVMRRTVARYVTIAQACTLQGIAADRLLEALNAVVSPVPRKSILSLQVIS
jgi:hypothetical protein